MPDARIEVLRYLEVSCPGFRILPLIGDASTRRFFRVVSPGGRTRVLMDYGRPFSGETDDIALSRIFEQATLRVAKLFGHSEEAGCLLLEDLGDRMLEAELQRASNGERFELLERAARLAARVALQGTPVLARSERAEGPALDSQRFRFEMDFFLEHYAQGLCGRASLPGTLRPALHDLADRAAASSRPVLCHRDFHSRNIMVLADGSLAMVDIQDARWGPDSYDLASLLYDAYVEIDPAWTRPLLAAFRAALEESAPQNEEMFRERLDGVAAQRMLKALGTFGYQIHVCGRSRYRPAVTRTLQRLERLLPAHDQTRVLHALLAEGSLLSSS